MDHIGRIGPKLPLDCRYLPYLSSVNPKSYLKIDVPEKITISPPPPLKILRIHITMMPSSCIGASHMTHGRKCCWKKWRSYLTWDYYGGIYYSGIYYGGKKYGGFFQKPPNYHRHIIPSHIFEILYFSRGSFWLFQIK